MWSTVWGWGQNYSGNLTCTSPWSRSHFLLNTDWLKKLKSIHLIRTPRFCNFRSGGCCIDHIFILREILEHRHRSQRPTAACFTDYCTAFTSVDREGLWKVMHTDSAPFKLVRLINYDETKAHVRAHGEVLSIRAEVWSTSTMSIISNAVQWCRRLD